MAVGYPLSTIGYLHSVDLDGPYLSQGSSLVPPSQIVMGYRISNKQSEVPNLCIVSFEFLAVSN
jgi:hypothetical protein